jgi:UDP-N-acetylmuramoyl-tripeptide--D-alanyl-D-alanine ligase
MKSFFKKIVVALITAEAKVVLRRHRPIIIGITGNVGKTSTKDAIYVAIKNSLSTRKSEKSFNSDIGVPITVLGLKNGWNNSFLWIKNIIDGFYIAFFSKEYPAVLVLEMGIDRPKDMEKMVAWVKPDIAVLTRLPAVPVHVEYFSGPEAVIEEKMKLVSALKPEGTCIYNHDDEIIQSQLPDILARTIGYSRYLPSDYTAGKDRILYQDGQPIGVECTISHEGTAYPLVIKDTLGTQHAYACTAAVAVADVLGVPLSEAVLALQDLETPPGRMRIIKGIKHTTVIDDTYNSSPTAVMAALESLRDIAQVKRRIAVLGDMLELGRFSVTEHERIGAYVATTADMLVTVGVRARKIAEAALAHGMDEANILQYEDAERAGRELQNILVAGDVVLVKASQGIRAERIVEEIMAEPEQAGVLLVRQDVEWIKKK